MSTTFRPSDQTTVLTAATTLTAAQSGGTFLLNTAGGFTVTLPAKADGLHFRFVAKTAPTTAYIIAAATADADLMVGGFVTSADGTAVDVESTAGADQINFVASTAVIGDYVDVFSDGDLWYCSGYCAVATGLTLTG